MKSLTAKFLIAIILINSGFITAFAQNNKKPKKLYEVKIYLLKEIEETDQYDPENPLGLFAVKRQVDAATPLAGALKALVKGATKQEERRQKLFISTFGIRFVSVNLTDGVVLARFTMPKTASFSGDNGPFIFEEAVRKTAVQFKEVKKVIVCLDGQKNFGLEDNSPIQKC
ncbi:MAG TPA: hypothetical protein PKY82_23640 [Pyrinomonadaceae bacterium]|nr:hypothetical protein [Pyrinomonadaceae bacterium]